MFPLFYVYHHRYGELLKHFFKVTDSHRKAKSLKLWVSFITLTLNLNKTSKAKASKTEWF
jgi:hypothetical protein